MNGNPLYHWIGLGIATALMVPMPAAMLLGWVPPWQKKYAAGVRLRACALLCMYGLVLANAIPRLADASYETVMACMNVGFAFIAATGVLFFLADRKDHRAAKDGRA